MKEAYKASGIEGGISFTRKMVEAIPIPQLSRQNWTDLANYSKQLTKLVDNRKSPAKLDVAYGTLEALVYELYSLSQNDIALIKNYKTRPESDSVDE